MAISALSAAKRVCELRDWNVTNLEIHKILYLTHMTMLGRSKGQQELVYDHFEAWDYGPVVPTLYHRLKAFGNHPVQNVFRAFPDEKGTPESMMIEEVERRMRHKTPGELISMTHYEDGAWAKNYRPGERNVIISNADILAEYELRVG